MSNTACNSYVYQKNLKFGLKYHPSMHIFVYRLCFKVMPNAAQVLTLYCSRGLPLTTKIVWH